MADFQRLPHTVLPVVYDLHITPDLKELTFQGFVKITVDVKEETKVVKVNAAELAIQKVIFSTNENDDGAVSAASIELNEKDEVATVTFDANLPLGKGFLSYTYTGILNDQMKGFYRSKYVVGEEERWAGVTQFEATDARRALPSWDEPAIKAQFDVTLTVPKDRVALSNMPVIKEEVNGEVKTLKFDRTPIMSTYLLAFVVGEFDYIEQYTTDGRIAVRVYTPLGKTDQGRFALDVAVRTLPYYEQWFGIEYPLPKADLIAIADFSAGAMENWGLITYRETALLVDPNSSSTSTKQWVALVVGHELAHQWFGNLVTMEWWTHLWLNEGFASWIEYLCVDYCFPEWNIWTQFITQDANNALSLDAMKSSHPIEVEVKHPSEIDEIFDSITYSKGSTVIRMLAGFLGEDVFKKALNLYLNRHKFSNTFTEDLWAAFEETSGKPVRELMDTWTKQMGFPVISVDEIEPGKYAIEQSRFLANEVASGADADFLWLVPVGAISEADSTEHFTVLKERKGVFEIPSVTQEGQWVKINPNQTGYYRVNYSARLLQQLKRGLTSNAIKNATDRLELQNDLFALARASIASTTSVLDFLSAYPDETDYTVWSDIAANLSSVTHLLSFNPEHKGIANKFGADLFRKVVASVGWEATPGESAQTSLLRPLVIRQLGKFGDATIIAEAKARLAQFAADKVSLAADLRAAVYGIALQYGGKEEYDTIFKIFEETDLQEEKVRCLRSFGASADPELLQKTLELALTPKVRSQDAVFVILSVASNPAGRQLAWDFFKANVNVFIEKYNGGFLLGRLAKGVVDGFASEEKALEAIQFFEQNPIASAKRAVDQAIETVRTNAKWIERDLDSIVSWFKQYSNSQ